MKTMEEMFEENEKGDCAELGHRYWLKPITLESVCWRCNTPDPEPEPTTESEPVGESTRKWRWLRGK